MGVALGRWGDDDAGDAVEGVAIFAGAKQVDLCELGFRKSKLRTAKENHREKDCPIHAAIGLAAHHRVNCAAP